jgi:hypothetical protein
LRKRHCVQRVCWGRCGAQRIARFAIVGLCWVVCMWRRRRSRRRGARGWRADGGLQMPSRGIERFVQALWRCVRRGVELARSVGPPSTLSPCLSCGRSVLANCCGARLAAYIPVRPKYWLRCYDALPAVPNNCLLRTCRPSMGTSLRSLSTICSRPSQDCAWLHIHTT